MVDGTCRVIGETGIEVIETGVTETEEAIDMATETEGALTLGTETETIAGTVERPLLGSKRGSG